MSAVDDVEGGETISLPADPHELATVADLIHEDPSGVDQRSLQDAIVRCHDGARNASDDAEADAYRTARKRVLRALSAVRQFEAEQGAANSHASDGPEVAR